MTVAIENVGAWSLVIGLGAVLLGRSVVIITKSRMAAPSPSVEGSPTVEGR